MIQASNQSAAYDKLTDEIDHWRAENQKIRFFLRDDYAVSDTPALRQLFELIKRNETPVLLATIPKMADTSLAALVGETPLVTPAAHGYAHVSHTPEGFKPCELDHFRPLEVVIEEMKDARDKLTTLFGDVVSALLVPPWNRIHEEVLPHVRNAGFAGVSAQGWQNDPTPVPMVNVHLDIIHWSGGVCGRDREWIYLNLAQNLEIARNSGWQPVGILTHHLVHDDQAWDSLEAIFDFARACEAKWIVADDLLAERQA
ncbi:MAG: polysaccharide deacetylase [Pseudomonadota bacterium]